MSGTRPMKKIDEPNNSTQLTALLYSIIFATASALRTASGAADSQPLGIIIIMKRI